MRFHALACDYDGTLATHGVVDAQSLAALERVRASGRKLLLVSGRQLDDLRSVFPRLDLFDRAVLENGALVVDPATGAEQALAEPPPAAFVSTLRSRGVEPLAVGRVIVATWQPHETVVMQTIRDFGLELQVIFNKGAVMVLPSGLNKAAGLQVALAQLGLSAHNVVAVGDAENDHALLAACELSVAVANSVPMLKAHADWVTSLDRGAGVRELVDELLEDDLRRRAAVVVRQRLELGRTAAGEAVTVPVHGPPLLVTGRSGSGKSTLAHALLEQLLERGYQTCVLDPEGDYGELADLAHLGDARREPLIAEVLDALAKGSSPAVNLLGVPLADRPASCVRLLAALMELRGRTGRPHWILLDEAHHLLPPALEASGLRLLDEATGLLLVTVHPENVSGSVLGTVACAVAVGDSPQASLDAFALAAGRPLPSGDEEPPGPGEGLAWPEASSPLLRLRLAQPKAERHRHIRKYAAGDLGDSSFHFRGPDGRLNLKAQNLQIFLQLADGVDDATWEFHRLHHDYSRWFRETIKDSELGDEAELIERDRASSPRASRRSLREAVERRYTAPA